MNSVLWVGWGLKVNAPLKHGQQQRKRWNKQACALSFLFARKSLHICNLPYNRGDGNATVPKYIFQQQGHIMIIKHTSSKMKNGRGTKIALTELQISGGISHPVLSQGDPTPIPLQCRANAPGTSSICLGRAAAIN